MFVATNCVAFCFDGINLKTFLVRRQKEPYQGGWSFPGALMHTDENGRDCATRVIMGDCGFLPLSLRQVGAFTAVHRDPRARVISIGYYALVKTSSLSEDEPEADKRWFSIDELPDLAFDHRRIFEMALDALRKSVHFEPAAFDLMPEVFTLPDLQKLYEIILGTTFDRRNFQKKMLSLGIIDEVYAYGGDTADYDMDTESIDSISPRRMKRLAFDALFAGSDSAAPVPYTPASQQEEVRISKASPAESSSSYSWSRRALHYRFNRENYKVFKQRGHKLEF